MRTRHTLRTLPVLVAAALLASPLGAETRRMFVTSVWGTGDLSSWPDAAGAGGIDAGDAICQARAAAAGLPNATAFRAWLSDAQSDAYCRMHNRLGWIANNCYEATLPAAAGPWWRTDGEPFGAGLPELLLGYGSKVLNAPTLDEFGSPVGEVWTFTGTAPMGGWFEDHDCLGWTSGLEADDAAGGISYATSYWWSFAWTGHCLDFWDPERRLLCMETGAGDPLPEFPAWGRLAFVTSAAGNGNLSSWPQAGGATGLEAGDAICRNLAAAAGIRQADSFRAWLSGAGTNAIDRFEHDGPWMRPDGILIASSKADLTDGVLASSIHLAETLQYQNGIAWTGTLASGAAAATHCASWTSASSSDSGETGVSYYVNFEWTQLRNPPQYPLPCEFTIALYCLQDLPLVFLDGFDTGGTRAWSAVAP